MKLPTFPSFALVLGATMITTTGSAQEALDRTVRPLPQPVPKVDLPDIQKAKLANGLKIWLVEHHELPLVAFNLVIQSGSDHDPLNMPGLASMTADVIDEGTKARDALQISDELQFIGATFGVQSNADGTFMTLGTLTKHLDKALDVYTDVLTNPTFPQKEFDRLKKQRLTSLLQQKDQPSTIASLAFNYILYGSNHPYGSNSSGTEASLNSMTREDLEKFYTSYYRPNNATLIIVGDATLKDITRKLEKALSDWKAAPVPVVANPAPSSVDQRRVYLIDKPGAAQSEIRIGYPALARNTPDYFPVTIMNRILGGQFTSRLNLNLREKHGFTYGARSGFAFNKQPGPFVASAGVTTAKTDSSLREFFHEIDNMHASGTNPVELDFVKKGLSGSFALSFETPAQVAGALQNVVLYNLPDDYYERYLQNIDKVTIADVNQASKKYLDSSQMAIVVVGDLKVIKEDVQKLNLGEMVLCDVDGKKMTQ